MTSWYRELRSGNQDAARQLWERYGQRIRTFASGRLVQDVAYDEDDLAQSVFAALCRAVEDGRYDEVADRTQLWRMIIVIAKHKMIDRHRRENTETKQKSRQVDLDCDLDAFPLDDLTPDEEVLLDEECERLISILDGPELQQIALLRVAGHQQAEIALTMNISERTVKRKMALIRKRWEMELKDENLD